MRVPGVSKKQSSGFKSFFKASAKPSTPAPAQGEKKASRWGTYYPPKSTTLAPVVRRMLLDDDLQDVDLNFGWNQQTPKDINQLRSSFVQQNKRVMRTRRQESKKRMRETHEASMATSTSTSSADPTDTSLATAPARIHHQMKLILFHTDVRPPYFGTFRKKSSVIRGRHPLKQDHGLFNYEDDSEAEWEPGDDQSGDECMSDDEDGEENEQGTKLDDDAEADEEKWLVPHGYLSDDEGAHDEDDMDGADQEGPDGKRLKKQAEEGSASNKRAERPYSIGCVWGAEALQHSKLGMYRVEALLPTPIAVFEEYVKPEKKHAKSNGKRELDAADYPDLIRLAHGSVQGNEKITADFLQIHAGYTKTSITRVLKDKLFSIREVRAPFKKMRRFVLQPVLELHKLADISLPTPDPVKVSASAAKPKIVAKAAPAASTGNAIMKALQKQATNLPPAKPKAAGKSPKAPKNSIMSALKKQATCNTPVQHAASLGHPALAALTNAVPTSITQTTPTTSTKTKTKAIPKPSLPPAPSAFL